MSEPKAQLVDPQGNMNLPGMNATGVITASSFSGDGGVVTGLTGSPNLNVGVVTATSFVGDGTGHAANLTGTPNLNLGLTTATSFIGDATGKAAGLTGTPNLNVGLITATSFVGNVTGDITGNITGNVTGNIVGDVTGNITGLASSIKSGNNLGVGVCTAIQLHGDGSNLTGAGSSAFIAQEITATGYGDGGVTVIDLSKGNLIYYTGESNTTVGFASTASVEQITFVRNTTPVTYDNSVSTASVDFDSGDNLTQTTDAVLRNWMDQEFTVEYWIKADSLSSTDGGSGNSLGASTLGSNSNFTWSFGPNGLGQVRFGFWTGSSETAILASTTISTGTWYHLAFVRQADDNCKIFIDGVLGKEYTITNGVADGGTFNIGKVQTANFDGKISNVRITHQALYYDDFIPPTGPLTTTSQGAIASNVKLLCCQSSTDDTAATVTPNTISANGTPTPGAETITQSGSINASIAWPNTVKWKGGITPTLFNDSQSGAMQIFRLTTGDTGASYQAWEEMKNNPAGPYGLFGWGSNVTAAYGQLGQNDNVSRSSPTQVGSENTWSGENVSRGYHEQATVGFIKTDGTLWMWGSNYNSGQLGQNQATAQLEGKSSPTQIPGTTWATISCGDKCQLMTKTDGTLWGLGINETGQLGLNDIVNRSSPTQIGTGTDWGNSKISANGGRVVKSDNTLWVWGGGWGGVLGLNSWTGYSSPIQIPGTTWSDVRSGGTNIGVKTDGTLWTWGYMDSGISGLNGGNLRRSSPTQVGTDTDWSKVFVGATEAACIKTDGSLWMWGANSYGNLAQNNGTARSSPTQVPGNWSEGAIGRYYTITTKTDGTLWTWGYNVSGQAGTNTTPASAGPNYSSPIQVGTDTGWANPYVTREGSWALREV